MRIFLLVGILESGKTTYLNNYFENDTSYLESDAESLLIICEEGEAEYNEKVLKEHRVTKVVFDEEPDDIALEIGQLIDEHSPEQVFIEWNCMWKTLPGQICNWLGADVCLGFIDGSTLGVYFNNMRQIFVNFLQSCDMVLINRAEDRDALEPYADAFMIINSEAEYLRELPDGYYETAFDDEAPFDKTADFIPLSEEDYPWFVVDANNHPSDYIGKEIEALFEVELSGVLGPNLIFAGRHVMVCCADDTQFFGLYCDCLKNKLPADNTFVNIRAKVTDASRIGVSNGVMLEAVKIEPAKEPENRVI